MLFGRLPALWIPLSFVGALPQVSSGIEPVHPGAALYQQHCVRCHGENGQGVRDVYEEPLHGNRTIPALASRIDRTMPEDDPDVLDAAQSALVAEYIHQSFYSPEAQNRLHPAQIELSRLTINQYRQSIADLVASIHPNPVPASSDQQGLRAMYTGRTAPPERISKKVPVIDPTIDFTFGDPAFGPHKLNTTPKEWLIVQWDGALLVEETGTYEFVVRTYNSAFFFLNNHRVPLIDAWINKSTADDMNEERASIFLIAGRHYPLRLQFFKTSEPNAALSLLWKPPHGTLQPIPSHHLSPVGAPETTNFHPRGHSPTSKEPVNAPFGIPEILIVNTPFPPDDRSIGYERGSTVSSEWEQATTDAAIEVAEYIEDRLDTLANTHPSAPDYAAKLQAFALRFAQTAFRRPLDEFNRLFIQNQFAGHPPLPALKRCLLFTLKSPRFLYPEFRKPAASTHSDPHDTASRLALSLWDSLPDAPLIHAADANQLNTREQIRSQAQRMLQNPRTKAKLAGFFDHWLELERATTASKDAEAFPQFNDDILADLRTSLHLFIDQVVWSERSDYRELLQANYLLLNSSLAKIYSDQPVNGNQFQRVAYQPRQRAGIVTHPYLLAAFAYNKTTSPIHRGVFLTRNIVGMTLNSPPVAVAFEESHFDPSFTMREKVTELTKNINCMGCHSTINPLGFSLENYDAIGRWQTHDNQKPVDTKTTLPTEDGHTITLTGARDIVEHVIASPASHRAFITQLFHHTVKQPVAAYGPDTLEDLRQSFVSSGFNIQQLLVNIATISATPSQQP
jgi:mono/diheme cytochrome c family protein